MSQVPRRVHRRDIASGRSRCWVSTDQANIIFKLEWRKRTVRWTTVSKKIRRRRQVKASTREGKGTGAAPIPPRRPPYRAMPLAPLFSRSSPSYWSALPSHRALSTRNSPSTCTRSRSPPQPPHECLSLFYTWT